MNMLSHAVGLNFRCFSSTKYMMGFDFFIQPDSLFLFQVFGLFLFYFILGGCFHFFRMFILLVVKTGILLSFF